MSYVDPDTRTDPQEIRDRIAFLRKLVRQTEWRSEAYRSNVEILDLKARLKRLKKNG